MNRLSDYVARTIAMIAAVGITALMVFVHAADRGLLGAPVAAASTTVAQSNNSSPSDSSRIAAARLPD